MGTERPRTPYLPANEPWPQAPATERKSLPVACPCSLLLGAHPFEQQAALMNGFPFPQQVGKLYPQWFREAKMWPEDNAGKEEFFLAPGPLAANLQESLSEPGIWLVIFPPLDVLLSSVTRPTLTS